MAFFSEFNKNLISNIKKFAGSFKIKDIINSDDTKDTSTETSTISNISTYSGTLTSLFSTIRTDFEQTKHLPLISKSDLYDINALRSNYGNLTASICYYAAAMNLTKESLYHYIYSKSFTGKSATTSNQIEMLYTPRMDALKNLVASATNGNKSIESVLGFSMQDFYDSFLLQALIYYDPVTQIEEYATHLPAIPQEDTNKNNSKTILNYNDVLDQFVTLNLASVVNLSPYDTPVYTGKLREQLENKLKYNKDKGVHPSFYHYDLASFSSMLDRAVQLVKEEESNTSYFNDVNKKLNAFFNKYKNRFGANELSSFINSLQQTAYSKSASNTSLNLDPEDAQLAVAQIGVLEYFYNAFSAYFGSLGPDSDWYNILYNVKGQLGITDSSAPLIDEEGEEETDTERLSRLYENQHGNVNTKNFDAELTGKGNSPDSLYKSTLLALDAARSEDNATDVNNVYQILSNITNNLYYQYQHPFASSKNALQEKQDLDNVETLIGAENFIKYFPSDDDVRSLTAKSLEKHTAQLKDLKRDYNKKVHMLKLLNTKKAKLEKAGATPSTPSANSGLTTIKNKIVTYQNELNNINDTLSEYIKSASFKDLQSLYKAYKTTQYKIKYLSDNTTPKAEKEATHLVEQLKSISTEITNKKKELSSILKKSSELQNYLDKNNTDVNFDADISNKLDILYEKRIKYELLLKESLRTVKEFDQNTSNIDDIDLLIEQYTFSINAIKNELKLAQKSYIYNVFSDVSSKLHKREDALRKCCAEHNVPNKLIFGILQNFSKKYNLIQYSLDESGTSFSSKNKQTTDDDSATKEKGILTESYNQLVNYNLDHCLAAYSFLIDQHRKVRTKNNNTPVLVDAAFLFNYFGEKTLPIIKSHLKGLKLHIPQDLSILSTLSIMVSNNFQGVDTKQDLVIALCYLSNILRAFYGKDAQGEEKNPELIDGFKKEYNINPPTPDYTDFNPLKVTDDILLYLQLANELLKGVPHYQFSDDRNKALILDRQLKEKGLSLSNNELLVLGNEVKKLVKELEQKVRERNNIKRKIEDLRAILATKDENTLSDEEKLQLAERAQNLLAQRDAINTKVNTLNNAKPDFEDVKTKQQEAEDARKNVPYKSADPIFESDDNKFNDMLHNILNTKKYGGVLEHIVNILIDTTESDTDVVNTLKSKFELPENIAELIISYRTNVTDVYKSYVKSPLTTQITTTVEEHKNLYKNTPDSIFSDIALIILNNITKTESELRAILEQESDIPNELSTYIASQKNIIDDYINNNSSYKVYNDAYLENTTRKRSKSSTGGRYKLNPNPTELNKEATFNKLTDVISRSFTKMFTQYMDDNNALMEASNYLRQQLSNNIENFDSLKDTNPSLYNELFARQKKQQDYDADVTKYNQAKEDSEKELKNYHEKQNAWDSKWEPLRDDLLNQLSDLNQQINDIEDLLNAQDYTPEDILKIKTETLPLLEKQQAKLDKKINSLQKEKGRSKKATDLYKLRQYLKGTETPFDRINKFVDNFMSEYFNASRSTRPTFKNTNGTTDITTINNKTYVFNDEVGKLQRVLLDEDGNIIRTYKQFIDLPEDSAVSVKTSYIRPGSWMNLTADDKTNPFLGQVPGLGGELTDTTKTYTSTENIENKNNKRSIENPFDVKTHSDTPNLSLDPDKKQESVKDFGKFLKSLNLQNPEDKAIFNKILHESSIVDDNSKVKNLPKFIQYLSYPNKKYSESVRQYNRSEGENLGHAYFQGPVTDLVNVVKQDKDIAPRLEEFKNKEEATK